MAGDGSAVAIVGLPDDPALIDEAVAAITGAGGRAIGVGADTTRKMEIDRPSRTAARPSGRRTS
jgi:hypothetical protein